MKNHLFPGVLLLTLPLGSGAEPTQQERYLEQVRTGLSAQLAGTSWRTKCYIDSHGLGTIAQLDFLANKELTLRTHRYYDSTCHESAEWEVTTRTNIEPAEGSPGGADLVSTDKIMLLRVRGPRIHVKRETWSKDRTFTRQNGE